MGFIFKVVTFIGGWLALGVLALGISAGLYIACDLAEEYSSIVKRYLQLSTYIICAIYLILIFDGLPYLRCLFGVATHIIYMTTLTKTFPFIQPVSIQTILSFVMTICNHIYWFNYFISDEYRYTLMDEGVTNAGMKVLGFLFIFVWIVPIGFFVSLQSIEDSLPMSGGMSSASSASSGGAYNGAYGGGSAYGQAQYHDQYQGQQYQGQYSGGSGGGGGKKKKGIFKGMVDSVLSKKEAMFPGVSKRQY
mmetsp:Transcript_13600/g.17172  ORF Transcript_13600/g.17172 Transcript_13600/m.17172 type:complete len:249 (-) Transcript_13600:237-983(-)